jgi:CRISPR-associated protein Cas2
MFVIVSYDIINNNKRNKVADILLDYGKRVQKSVYECDLDEKNLNQMIKETTFYINPDEDNLRIYRLCEGCITKIKIYGKEIISEMIV